MPEHQIRKAQGADIGAIASLSGQLGYPVDETAIAERLRRIQSEMGNAVFVAEGASGGVLGWAHVFVAHRLESPSFAELGGLVVSEEARGRGVGRSLLDAAEQWARGQELATMRIRSNVVRIEAHGFYRHLGYETMKNQAVFRKPLPVVGP